MGYTYKTDFMKKNFSSCLAKNGQIYVNDLMQISSTDPKINSLAVAAKANVFCLGDCCLTSLNEEKCVPLMKEISKYVFANVI